MKCGDGRDEPRVNDVHEVYSPSPHSGFGFSTKEGEEKAWPDISDSSRNFVVEVFMPTFQREFPYASVDVVVLGDVH